MFKLGDNVTILGYTHVCIPQKDQEECIDLMHHIVTRST